MNGVHDMGGMHGMGPIVREENEPVFHHDWEGRVLALNLAAGALEEWNIDMSRHARERMPAAQYLAASYYESGSTASGCSWSSGVCSHGKRSRRAGPAAGRRASASSGPRTSRRC